MTVRHITEPPEAKLAGREVRFYPIEGGYQAITSLSVDHAPGPLKIDVSLPEQRTLTAELEVREPTWRTRELTVASKFVKPPKSVKKRMAADKKAFAKAFAQPWSKPMFTGSFAWPRRDVLTAFFGDRRTYNGKLQSQHYGTDIDGSTGDPVVATNAGRVVMVRDNYAAGLTVLVDHGAGIITAYFHLSKVHVKEGEVVTQGQLIGDVGKSGRVTGPHLHFGVKIDGLYVDAQTLLRLDFSSLEAPVP